jgi:hypothetical protein
MPGRVRKAESLDEEVGRVIEESRMVLPGIQAIFGFQLIAVFNQRFETGLAPHERYLPLAATILVAVSIALIMAPAAYHRQAEPGIISRYFVDLASRLLTAAMLPLQFAIALEVFLVARLSMRPAAAKRAKREPSPAALQPRSYRAAGASRGA